MSRLETSKFKNIIFYNRYVDVIPCTVKSNSYSSSLSINMIENGTDKQFTFLDVTVPIKNQERNLIAKTV